MATRHRFCLAVALVAASGSAAPGHYHLLLPAGASGAPDQAVEVTLAWGHPFEHQLFDTAKPARLVVIGPDGTVSDLPGRVTPTRFGGKSGPAAFRVSFTPTRRGDHVFVADA